MDLSFTVDHLDIRVYRAPIAAPVVTSFGAFRDRAAVVVKATARDGSHGWGEVWANFPTVAAEYRARLLEAAIGPLLAGRRHDSPAAAYADLTRRGRVLAIQAGEPGPVGACIAGIDIALWDLVARRAGIPLWRALGGEGAGEVAAYASGINPTGAGHMAAAARAAGHRAFKLKIGFGQERDLANLAEVRAAIGGDCRLMVDANQAYDLATAIRTAEAIAPFDLTWLEEPMPADTGLTEWAQLAAVSPVALAAGENLCDAELYAAAARSGSFRFLQPDMCKWGGFSGLLPSLRVFRAAGVTYCPHFLAGGLGMIASAHLLKAGGGDGLLEFDVNPNPLREGLAQPFPTVADGRVALPTGPGLGVAPDEAAIAPYLVARAEVRAA